MPLQPPSESEILTSYLLHPSPLPTILPYKSFLALLPPGASAASARQHPTELKRLYRDLQYQRDVIVHDVSQRIEDECRRSVELTARLGRQIRREEEQRGRKRKRNGEDEGVDNSDVDAEEQEQETHFDTALHGGQPLGTTLPTATAKHNHTTTTLLEAMASATRSLSDEIADLEKEIAALHKESQDMIGNLSDLPYDGRSAREVSPTATEFTIETTEEERHEQEEQYQRALEIERSNKKFTDWLQKLMTEGRPARRSHEGSKTIETQAID
ncbi:uncharacterized protein Z520_07244 [Fonsecaea multimorphosa CBS 102226]|uniref:Uncharacterized protein n=1 Tax=Fonsecaea multimorphosa CBS 102226 TaxID=1442371 RepID=A0A0D2H5K1_9EURO|nr:uncharacterized protein Z520_07244 [Fonsecaea multimorphosa CBS 102226]KIX97130.1 hypothetical protein Z520_07244 [Fonsecaea multimorphosa CBS 102226]OAL22906.1 hypothetical protein AYO22_06814 [Fonsecaea multimorphosa]